MSQDTAIVDLTDDDKIVITELQQLLSYTDLIEHKFFKDDEGYQNVKTRVYFAGEDFTTVNRINGQVNRTFAMQRNVNILLEVIEEHIRDGKLTNVRGVAIELQDEDAE